MPPPQPLWRWAALLGSLTCITLAALYPISRTTSPALRISALRTTVSFRDGQFGLLKWPDAPYGLSQPFLPAALWIIGRPGVGPMQWGFRFYSGPGSQSLLLIPFWAPLLAVFLPTAYACHRCRRRPGHCRCGYDLTGIAPSRCPECGAHRPLQKSRPMQSLSLR